MTKVSNSCGATQRVFHRRDEFDGLMSGKFGAVARSGFWKYRMGLKGLRDRGEVTMCIRPFP